MVEDFRFGIRRLFSRPGFTATSVVTLAVGISVTTAMFSVLDTLYWNALPSVPNASRVLAVETVAPDGSMVRGAWLDFQAYRDSLKLTAGVAAHTDTTLNLGLSDRAKPVRGALVSSNYFDVLGLKAVHGRLFSAEEHPEIPGRHPFAVISHSLWMTEYGGSESAVGSTIRVNRHNLVIIGVTPPAFGGAIPEKRADIWVPFTMAVALGAIEKDTFSDPSMRNVWMFARLAPGAGIDEARAQLAAVAARLEEAHPRTHRAFRATCEPIWRAHVHGRAAVLQPMVILMGISLLVLAIVCANVANLLLAGSVGRLREFGVRTALGARRWRLARLLFIETLTMAAVAAAIGIPLALWMTDAAVLLLPKMARSGHVAIDIDVRILAFAVVITVSAAFACTAAPALLALRTDVNRTLREGGRSGRAGARSHWMRAALVVSEVALALVVLVGAGLLWRSYRNAVSADLGFDNQGVVLARLSIASAGYSVEELESFCLRLRSRLESSPGLTAVSYADYAPLWSTDGPYTSARPEGFVPRHPEDVKVHRTSVAPGYFHLLKIPLLEGREFTESDDRNAPLVMIVDQAFARRFYDGASPIGRRVQVWKKWFTVVGLVRDSKYFSYTEEPRPHFYLAFRQSYYLGQQLVLFVRSAGDPDAAVSTLRREVAAVDSNAAGFSAAPMIDYNAMLLTPLKLASGLLTALAVIAFILAAVGLYGVMSCSVNERTQELGIRMALGAKAGDVVGGILRSSLALTGAGVGIGLVLALVTARLLRSVLVGIDAFDPATFGAASAFLVAVAASASLVPALRATRIDPGTALRVE